MKQFSEELNYLLEVIKEVNNEIMQIYNSDFSHEIKKDKSPVTSADFKSNDILIKRLSKFGYSFISEESENDITRYESEYCWVIDPIDGTKDFIQKTSEFSIMVALIKNNIPILGVVSAPAINKIFFAEKNKGAYLIENNNKPIPIQVNSKTNIKEFIMPKSRNHFTESEQKLAHEIGIVNFLPMGSIGIKLMVIAQGNADFFFSSYLRLGEWDLCAPHIILEEAGGTISTLTGEKIKYNKKETILPKSFVATNSNIPKEKYIPILKRILL